MLKKTLLSCDESDGPPSPYDAGQAEGDLWFLPDQAEVPAPRPGRDDWAGAQAGLSGELADLARLQGILQERLAGMGPGAVQRLALQEAADLSWLIGARIGLDRLGLWLGAHLGGAGEDGPALSQAAWAARRLRMGQVPSDLATFLDRRVEADMADLLQPGLHPITQAARLYHMWRGQGAAAEMEAAVMAACQAGAGHGFLPLALAGGAGLRARGDVAVQLAAWIHGAAQAVQTALSLTDRLRIWTTRARRDLDGMSGRTPGLLVQVFIDWPQVSAPLAEAHSGASRAAVQRNLDALAARALIREVTGQGRYRVWTAEV